MGPNQSKRDEDCRRSMREQIEEAKSKKDKPRRGSKKDDQTAGAEFKVVEMDKIGNVASD